MVVIVLVVRIQLGDEQEERPVRSPLGVLVQIINGKGVDAIHPVANKIVAVHVAVKHIAVVSVGGYLQRIGNHPVFVSAPALYRNRLRAVGTLLIACQVPLADVGRLVSGGVHPAGQRIHADGQNTMVLVAIHLGCIHAGLQAGPRGAAYRLAGKRIFKQGSFAGKPVQHRRYRQTLPVTPHRIPALLI